MSINPTNPIDPYNLEIPIDFVERLGVTAIKLEIYLPAELVLTAALIPLFMPSLMPMDLFEQPMPTPEGMEDMMDLVTVVHR